MEKKTPLNFSKYILSSESKWFWLASAFVLLTYFSIFFETRFVILSYARYVLGPLYFFYLPGALIVETVYGKEGNKLEKLAASIGLSFVITILNGLGLDFLNLGITSSLVATSLMTITQVLAVVMLLKRYLYHKVIDFEFDKSGSPSPDKESTTKRRMVSLSLKFAVFLSYLFLIIFVFTLPHFDYGQPDPYFHLSNLPLTYWIGLSISVITILVSVLKNQPRMGLWSLFAFIALTNSIPRLMYKNKIWYDTYPFVGETFHVIRNGQIGFASGPETPGISVFTAQLSMLSGINYLSIASFLPLLMPLIVGLLVYLTARFFLNKEGAVLASLFYFSFNWLGFYFNRESFSLILQLLTWYFTLQVFKGKTFKRFSCASAILSFLALIASHPPTSLFIVFNTFSPIVLIALVRLIQKHKFTAIGRRILAFTNLAIVFFLMWATWYSSRTIDLYVGEVIGSMESFLVSPDPASRTATVIARYTDIYYPIVMFRFYEVIFSIVAGFFLALFIIFYSRFKWKTFLLSAWYLSTLAFTVYIIYSVRTSLIYRSFLYSLPSLSILLVLFLLQSNSTHTIKKLFTKAMKMFLVSNVILFTALLPITMYAPIPFTYPPTATLNYENFLASHAPARIVICLVGAHVETDYFNLVSESDLIVYRPTSFSFEENRTFDIIGWVYRGYAKEAFVSYSPSPTQNIANLRNLLETNPELISARAYVVNSFHIAYVRQNELIL